MINIQLREASFCLDCGCCRSVTSFWLAPINHIGQPQTALRALKAAAHFLRRSHVSYGARHSAVYVNGEQLTFLASLHYCVSRGGAHSGDEADPKLPPTLLRRQPLTLLCSRCSCYPTTTTMQPSQEKSKCVQSCV